jgi:ribose transport system ATP-binding protein
MQLAGNLSGGNQQKVSLAKWLAANTEIIIIDEPTVGIDVRTKASFHELIMNLADEGISVLLISSDLPEMVSIADRVMVMRDYRFVGEFDNSKEYVEMSTGVMEAIQAGKASLLK